MRLFAVLLLPALLAACAPEPPLPEPPPGRLMVAAAPFPLATSPELEALRDPRPSMPPRPRALLVVEIQGLESLFATTPPDARDRPALMRRLADGYVELVRAASREHDDRAAKIVLAGRRAAIGYYTKLVKEYPAWCRAAPSGCADEAQYLLGFEHEKLGELAYARLSYLQLVQASPSSRFVPFVYLAIGDLFVSEAAEDASKWLLARQSFEEVLKSPPPDNPLYGYALLRLAQIHARLGHAVEAGDRRAQLRDLVAQNPGWAPAEIPAQLAGEEAP